MKLSKKQIAKLKHNYYTNTFKNETFVIDEFFIDEDSFTLTVIFNSNDTFNVPLNLIDRFFQHIGYIALNYRFCKNNQKFRYLFINNVILNCLRPVRPRRALLVKGELQITPITDMKKKLAFRASITNSVKIISEAIVFL